MCENTLIWGENSWYQTLITILWSCEWITIQKHAFDSFGARASSRIVHTTSPSRMWYKLNILLVLWEIFDKLTCCLASRISRGSIQLENIERWQTRRWDFDLSFEYLWIYYLVILSHHNIWTFICNHHIFYFYTSKLNISMSCHLDRLFSDISALLLLMESCNLVYMGSMFLFLQCNSILRTMCWRKFPKCMFALNMLTAALYAYQSANKVDRGILKLSCVELWSFFSVWWLSSGLISAFELLSLSLLAHILD